MAGVYLLSTERRQAPALSPRNVRACVLLHVCVLVCVCVCLSVCEPLESLFFFVRVCVCVFNEFLLCVE